MERRKAITTAAAASLTLLAGAAGMALSSDIVGVGGDGKAGQISPVGTGAGSPATVHLDDPATAGQLNGAPLVRPTTALPVTTSAASACADDDRDDDEDHDRYDDDDDRDEHESEDRDEYEGADDDD